MPLTTNALHDLAEGVAQQLAADTDPALNIAWQPDGEYPTGKVGIYMLVVPTSPDTIITLSARRLTADPQYPDSEFALQARFRGTPDPRSVWALSSAVSGVVLGNWPHELPNGLPIKTVAFAGGGSLGMDSSERWTWADNYVYGLGEHRTRPY